MGFERREEGGEWGRGMRGEGEDERENEREDEIEKKRIRKEKKRKDRIENVGTKFD